MTVSEMFKSFLENLKVDNAKQISERYGEITKKLNQKFRDSDSKNCNCLRVGSYGRYTGIKGISDLDMLYIMPNYKWDTYKNNQTKLLTDVKDAIKERYPNTSVRVDKLVVVVTFSDFQVEVQPVFEEFDDDGEHSHYKYPVTYDGGSWGKTKPCHEMAEVKNFNDNTTKNHRLLCKMVRAWKNKHGVVMGGLLIDTLAYNFLKSNDYYDDKSYMYFDCLSRDFFKYLSDEEKKSHYKAPGSNQNVEVTKNFQSIAKETYDLCVKAIESEGKSSMYANWKKVYGRQFPSSQEEKASFALESYMPHAFDDTEEYIEDNYPINIKYPMGLDCEVSQHGFRPLSLRNMLVRKFRLKANKKLLFKADVSKIKEPFQLKWKVLNRGDEAIRRNCIRGQIIDDQGHYQRSERTSFRGEHLVECYAINNERLVVARAAIEVPISEI